MSHDVVIGRFIFTLFRPSTDNTMPPSAVGTWAGVVFT
jgi:hypothetical protein